MEKIFSSIMAVLAALILVSGCMSTSIGTTFPDGDETDGDLPSWECPGDLVCAQTAQGPAFCMTETDEFPVDASRCEDDSDCPPSLVCAGQHGVHWGACLRLCYTETDGDESSDGDMVDGDDPIDGDTLDGDETDGDTEEDDSLPECELTVSETDLPSYVTIPNGWTLVSAPEQSRKQVSALGKLWIDWPTTDETPYILEYCDEDSRCCREEIYTTIPENSGVRTLFRFKAVTAEWNSTFLGDTEENTSAVDFIKLGGNNFCKEENGNLEYGAASRSDNYDTWDNGSLGCFVTPNADEHWHHYNSLESDWELYGIIFTWEDSFPVDGFILCDNEFVEFSFTTPNQDGFEQRQDLFQELHFTITNDCNMIIGWPWENE
jgi:hypothetical protein